MNNIVKFISLIPKPNKISNCWLWDYSISDHGYGRYKLFGKMRYAHRISYEIYFGKIGKNLEIDHLCRNRNCINPRHMELVSTKENTQRGLASRKKNFQIKLCKRNHPYFGANIISHKNNKRSCRLCARENWKNYNYEKRR